MKFNKVIYRILIFIMGNLYRFSLIFFDYESKIPSFFIIYYHYFKTSLEDMEDPKIKK